MRCCQSWKWKWASIGLSQPDRVADDVVRVKVKDINLAKQIVIEDEIATLGPWSQGMEVMFRETFTQFRLVRVNAGW